MSAPASAPPAAATPAPAAAPDHRPAVLVLGGCGFIGRNFVKFLVQNRLCSHIRVCDKQLPQTSFMNEELRGIFEHVEFIQSNLCQPAHVTRAFAPSAAFSGRFSYVFNLAGETRFGLEDLLYRQFIVDLAVACGQEAARHGVQRFIEISTGQVYKPGSSPRTEASKLAPWTRLAHNKLAAENALREIRGLSLIIVRPSVVYGPGDMSGIAPRAMCGAIYQSQQKKMKSLWSSSLKVNTVHVHDVVRALWHLTQRGTPGQVYNLSDKQGTDQGHINATIGRLFGIKTGFMNAARNMLASMYIRKAVEAINDKHMEPWHNLCKSHNINNTPLSPYIDQELLVKNNLNIDGSKIERETGFVYEVPEFTKERLAEQVLYHINQGIFPRVNLF